jgi:hypothetical protein
MTFDREVFFRSETLAFCAVEIQRRELASYDGQPPRSGCVGPPNDQILWSPGSEGLATAIEAEGWLSLQGLWWACILQKRRATVILLVAMQGGLAAERLLVHAMLAKTSDSVLFRVDFVKHA